MTDACREIWLRTKDIKKNMVAALYMTIKIKVLPLKKENFPFKMTKHLED